MNPSIMKRLVRTYYETTLGDPKGFPYWGALCDSCEKDQDPENKFYELLGYKAFENYSAKEIHYIRKQDAKRNYTELKDKYKARTMDQLSAFISRVKARATVLKKSAIPERIYDEVKVLSEYIRLDDNMLVQFKEGYVPVSVLLNNLFPSQEDLNAMVKKLTKIVSEKVNFKVVEGNTRCFNGTVHTNKDLTAKEQEEIIKCSLISVVIPYLFMDFKRAFTLYLDKGVYQLKDKDEEYLEYLDQLHHKDVTMPQVFYSIGLEYFNILEVYQNLGVLAQRQNEDIILVSNEYSSNIIVSPSEFEWCRERDYLKELVNSKDGVKVDSLNSTLNMLKGVSSL